MKQINLVFISIIILCSCSDKQLHLNSIGNAKNIPAAPSSIQCESGKQWISFDTGKNKCGSLCIDKASFFTNGRYRVTLLEKSAQGYTGGVYFIVEGNADYTVNEKGHGAVTLHPQSGWSKKDSINAPAQPINDTELNQKFTATYLWEKIEFPQMHSQDFLIMAKPDSNNNADKSSAVKLRLQ